MEQNSQDPTPSQPVRRDFYNMVLAEVIFLANGEVQVLRHQYFEKGDTQHIRAHRLANMQNTAAFQVMSKVPEEARQGFKTLDVFILGIIPLGAMTEEEFWGGMTQEQAAAALPEGAPDGDNVLPFNKA